MRTNIQVLGGKTGYNDDARYCLVIATKIDGHTYFMSFLSNEGKLTRFGDVARVADWVVSRRPKGPPPGIPAPAKSTTTLVSTHTPARAHAPARPRGRAVAGAIGRAPAPSESAPAPAAESPPRRRLPARPAPRRTPPPPLPTTPPRRGSDAIKRTTRAADRYRCALAAVARRPRRQ